MVANQREIIVIRRQDARLNTSAPALTITIEHETVSGKSSERYPYSNGL
jgi:hypothetical protein